MLNFLIRCIDEKSTKQTDGIEFTEIIENSSANIIGICVFGLKLDMIANSNSTFRLNVKKLITPNKRFLFVQIMRFLFPSAVKTLKLRSFPSGPVNFFHSVFNDVVEYRTKNNVVRNDVTQTSLEAKKQLILKNNDQLGEGII